MALVVVALVLFARADWTMAVGMVVGWVMVTSAAVVLWRRAGPLPQGERRAWRLVAAGFMFGSIGIVLTVASGLLIAQPATFGPQDVLFVLAYLLGMIGAVQLPHSREAKAHRLQTFFDGLIGGLSVALLLWATLLADIAADLTGNSFEASMGRLYPVVDLVVLVTVITVAIRRTAVRFDPRMLTLAAGMATQAVVDVIFLASITGRVTFAGGPERLVVGLGIVAMACYFAVALLPDIPIEPQIRRPRPPLLVTAIPFVMVTVLVVMLATEAANSAGRVLDADRTGTFAAGVAVIIVLLLIRQGVSIRENRVSLEIQKSELVSAISHEIRTPLSAILASLELVHGHAGDLTTDEHRELSTMALDQTRYMARMVEDMILLSRNSKSGVKLRKRSADLDEIITRAASDIGIAGLRRSGVTGLQVQIDPDRVRQALGNYFSNARQYGGSMCEVHVAVHGGKVSVEVHDDGPGVPYRFREVIWDHFERGSHRLDSQIQGSGIGLAVVDAVARAHGGHVEYRRSNLLGGACFSLILPLD